MNRLLAILLLGLLPIAVQGADQRNYTYEGEISGVICSACASHVKTALLEIEGVTDVKITLGKEGGLPRLKVVSTSPTLTREAAVKALGEKAKMYDIRSFTKVTK